MKFALKLFAGIAALVVVVAVVAFFQIDRMARAGIERGSTYALGVPTSLASASIGIRKGELGLEALEISNPPGFDSSHFLTLATGRGSVVLGSLLEDVVELPLLELENLDLNLEKKGGESNYKVILANLRRLEGSERPAEAGEGKRFVIRRIEIRNVNVHVDLLPIGGELSKMNVPIDVLSLEDVGSGSEQGLHLADVSGVLLKAILAAVLERGGHLPGEILQELSGGLAGLAGIGQYGIEVAGKALGGVGQGVEDAARDVGKALEGAAKGLDDLLGGKKD